MAERFRRDRRHFLKLGAAAGGGLVLGLYLGPRRVAAAAQGPHETGFTPNAWVHVGVDDRVTIRVASSEMGQGVMTAIPMLVAEELDADWSRVDVQTAPVGEAYVNPILRTQGTGGSTAVRGFWGPCREAGASAREMLVAAAARAWGVAPEDCRTEGGRVMHPASTRSLRYGDLAQEAARLPVPEVVFLKEPGEFRLLGRPIPRLDIPEKVDGSAVFGQDLRRPGMFTALVLRCPVFGGRLKGFDARRAMAVPGVRQVFEIPSGVAVVADGFWAAKRARDALEVEWEEGENAALTSAGISARFRQALTEGGAVTRQLGDVAQALNTGVRQIRAEYQVPYLAHACMEPMCCTAHVRRDGCELWVPTQTPMYSRATAARITGLDPEAVSVHTTFLGGGFGRRSEQDFVAEAVHIAKAFQVPIKLLWTREDDMRHDVYRPAAYNRLSAALDAEGNPVAWRHDIAGPSILSRVAPKAVREGIDRTSVEGASDLPYAIPNLLVTYALVDPGIPVGFWRSVGHSQNAYVTECFLDELAAAARHDPLGLRLRLLEYQPRHRGVLERAAEAAGWGDPLPEGRSRGIAVAESFASYVAQVAEVTVSDDGTVRVHRVVCAVDCGMTVNPDTIEAQMQSGIVYGLSAALMGEITLHKGRVQQGNFHDYPVLRMDQMPRVEVHIVTSDAAPGGIGEPGTPPIAPAVANAVFAATGRPVRSLPIRLRA
jgi:isoquinoline 1-oxidoreductase beta subunit